MHRKTKSILSQKVEVVDEQMWTGSSRGGGVTVCKHTYVYIYIHTHIYGTTNDPAPLHKTTVKYSVCEHYAYLCLPPGKGST